MIILMMFYGSLVYAEEFDSTFSVGDGEFNMPKGYHEGIMNNLGAVNITNGKNTVFLYEYGDDDVMSHIKEYKDLDSNKNRPIEIVNITFDGIKIYKTDMDGSKKTHYWFVKNDKTYDVYTWENNFDMDGIVRDLIKS